MHPYFHRRFLAALSLTAVLALLAGCGPSDAEITERAQEKAELEQLRAEHKELERLRQENRDNDRIRKDGQEVLKLRADYQKYQTLQKDYEKLQTHAQGLSNQIAQLNASLRERAVAAAAPPGTAVDPELARRYGLIPGGAAAPAANPASTCISHLRMIEGAKEQWALENKRGLGSVPSLDDIRAYLKGNQIPPCPGGGNYTITAVGTPSSCSLPGHKM